MHHYLLFFLVTRLLNSLICLIFPAIPLDCTASRIRSGFLPTYERFAFIPTRKWLCYFCRQRTKFAALRSPFLSRKELRFVNFLFVSICILSFYKRIVRFVPAIPLDCTASRIRSGFLLSKDKVLSLLATSLLNRNPYGFPINGSPVF